VKLTIFLTVRFLGLVVVVHVDGVGRRFRTAATNGPIVNPQVIYDMDSHGGMILTGKNEELGEKTSPNANLLTINPTWTCAGANRVLCGERPATNHLSNCTAFSWIYSVHPRIYWDSVTN
jgi:hypothetical protein